MVDPAAPVPSLDDLPGLRRWLANRPDADRLRPLTISRIVIASDALEQLPDLLAELDSAARVVMVQDDVLYRRGDDEVKPLVRELLARRGRSVEVCTLPRGHDGLVHADPESVAHVRAAIGARPAAVVAVGAGTVCDVAKHACYLAEQEDDTAVTLTLMPSAVSVTAFTSNLAILLIDGVKRTRPSRFADAVLCDLATLASAPRPMTLAGLGDCCARFISYGDWYLSDELGLVDLYSDTPLALMGEDLAGDYVANADAIGQGRPEGIAFVTRQVLLAGLAQSIMSMSAPLSGTEHVVSHVLDMGAAAWDRPVGLHGLQVGVATLLAARAYELLFERFDPGRPRPAPPVPESARAAIRDAFLPLDPTGRMADECWRDYSRKLARWTEQPERFDAVRARWDAEIAPRLRSLVLPPDTVREILTRAGHPLRFEDLTPRIPSEQVRFAIANAHYIRERFTIGDLFAFLGWGGEALADELLASTSIQRGT